MIINIFKLLYINNGYTTYRIKRKLDSIFNLVVLFDAYNKNINNLIINIAKLVINLNVIDILMIIAIMKLKNY